MKKTIGIIGLGNMGSAIAKCSGPDFIGTKLGFDIDRKKCTKIKKLGIKISKACFSQTKRRGLVKIAKNSCELVKRSDIVILAIKPQEISNILREIKDFITGDKLIVSIAAGVRTEYIERIAGKIPVIRVMPNIAILVKEGISAICRGRHATSRDERIVCEIFNAMGRVVIIPERFMDAVTALSGSGPAYFFEIINSLIKAGTKLGLSLNQVRSLVFQTARGAVTMLEQINNDPAVLRDMVTSKKGTTIEGLKVLWKNRIEKILIKTVAAAKKRARELSKLLEKYRKT